jgi:hypothetical protein
MNYENTTFDYNGDAAGPDGTFTFEVQTDDHTIVIGHGDDNKLTLTEVALWNDKTEDWVDGSLSDAPKGWEAMVRDAQDAYAEDAYESHLSSFYGG